MGEVPPVDLTPRTGPDDAAPPGRRRSRRTWTVVGVVVLLALAGVVARGLSDATVFFKNVDEAVAEKSELGERNFRMQGTVVHDTVVKTDEGVDFTLRYRHVEAQVVHTGSEPALFENNEIPVVAEGHWDGDVFRSERIVVKHDESYEEDRLVEADRGGRE